jgi:phenylalanine ammonia-lyase
VQDRYSIRTAPQWIGPQLEDLLLADTQISIELNSTSDNPIIDVEANDVLCGGNFQATSVTSAMEKTRLALQMFGRLLFSQVTELVNPNLSQGLPANLAVDDPSLSFTMKGVEISMASYMAELSYLANPMSSHVQPAEMHNQSVNSMALASARMSMEALDLLTMMCACSLYVGCQALDLRVLHQRFIQKATEAIQALNTQYFGETLMEDTMFQLNELLIRHIPDAWKTTGKQDLEERCEALVNSFLPIVLDHVGLDIVAWKNAATDIICETWTKTSRAFLENQTTAEMLGAASKALYLTVREELNIPFHHGFVEHPTLRDVTPLGCRKRTVGRCISVIYDAIRDGRVYELLMKQVKEDLRRAEHSMRDDFSDWD